MQYWWSDTDRGTPKYSEKCRPTATLLKAELTWTVLGSRPRLELLSVTFSDTVFTPQYTPVTEGCTRNAVPWLRRLVTGLAPLNLRSFHVRFVVDREALGQVVFSTSVFPYEYHFTNAPYSSLSTFCSYQKDKLGKAWKL